ncbi:hypothetical protein ACFSKM_18240 [Ancylobacter dichloromethanicus]|uniref:Uncharacterized protein n=1 Tax=Ancylobacter dichloromethanicus TaxID=518825 RepID=A0A9W6JB26_9HYPH|nr:hypothetical protein [Ancylobacter dichloromethanicus]GLK74206.1 hypothetical protein GCM10017643_43240 [Ancylobacter dichloromethanicus]
MRQLLAVVIMGAGLWVGAGLPARAQDAPDYAPYREGLFLSYLNAAPGEIGAVPRLGLSFGGEPLRAELDSGSTGIVVAAEFVPGFEAMPSQGPARLTYTSSGRVMLGQWVVTPVTLSGREGASVTTEPLPVLVVTEVQCLGHARDCRPTTQPRNIAMIGVGFAREGDSQSQSTPDKNPLLHVTGGDGRRRQGYILSPEGVHVGLTAANTRGAFRYLKLVRRPDGADWAPLPGCIALGGSTLPACGTVLIDTGVSVMYMTVPAAQAPSVQGTAAEGTLPPGTQVAISVGEEGSAFPLYSFAAGDGSPLAPDAIHLRVADDRVFVNTSYHLLNGFDMLFDGEGGYVGFRPR